ncbi:MAG: hypothetical protein SPE19_09010, partial [Candidatus Faecousia sp.]|nr:hypothetical protein [Candidatus Faecousia sp.]
MEWILVKAGSGGQKPRPLLPAAGELGCHMVGHLPVKFCFGWHGCCPPFVLNGNGAAFCAAPLGVYEMLIHQNPGTVPAGQ